MTTAIKGGSFIGRPARGGWVGLARSHDLLRDRVPFAAAAGAAADDDEDEDAPPRFKEIVREGGIHLVGMKVLHQSFGKEREEWRQALENELNSLIGNSSYHPLTPAEGRDVRPQDILPMTVVAGEKAPDSTGWRRKKARACVCGNFESQESGEINYTSNLDVSSLRAALAIAARRRWSVGALDVSTAFLNAFLPVEKKRIVMRPPRIFVKFGLVPEGELWVADRAIYGLRCSPKAWAEQRDGELAGMVVKSNGIDYVLAQSHADPAVWSIRAKDDRTENVVGYILSYVDDFLCLGEASLVAAWQRALGSLWKVSTQPVIGPSTPGSLRYLSIDIGVRADATVTLSQRDYTLEMLEKWGMASCKGTGSINVEHEPYMFFGIDEAEDPESTEEPSIKEVRDAQRMSGGLLWLSSRTRPDLAYAVSRIAAMATKRPKASLILGKKVLRYLAATKTVGLAYVPYGSEGGGDDGTAKVDTYADASHEDVGTQSGVASYVYGCLVDWRSTRQQVICFSTAEAEVNALALGNQCQDSIEATLNSMGIITDCTLYGDNQAANLIAVGRGTWRTRALSTKVGAIKSRLERGLLKLLYVATADMRADGLTKAGGVPHTARVRGHFGLRAL